jgi:hypothetical protein
MQRFLYTGHGRESGFAVYHTCAPNTYRWGVARRRDARFKEDAMKKIVMLLGLAAAVYGAMRLLRSQDDDEFAIDDPLAPSAYTPQPQS